MFVIEKLFYLILKEKNVTFGIRRGTKLWFKINLEK